MIIVCDSLLNSALLHACQEPQGGSIDISEEDVAAAEEGPSDSEEGGGAADPPSRGKVSDKSKKMRRDDGDKVLADLSTSLASYFQNTGGAASSPAAAAKVVGCLFMQGCDCTLSRVSLDALGINFKLGAICPECDHLLSKHSA